MKREIKRKEKEIENVRSLVEQLKESHRSNSNKENEACGKVYKQVKTPSFKSPVESNRESKMSNRNFGCTIENSTVFYPNASSEVTLRGEPNKQKSKQFHKENIYFIDQIRPNTKKKLNFGVQKDLDNLFSALKCKSIDQWIECFNSYKSNSEFLHTLEWKVLEYEEFDKTDHNSLLEVISNSLARAEEYEDVSSILNYTKKLLKWNNYDEIIAKLKILIKRKKSRSRSFRDSDASNASFEKYYKQLNHLNPSVDEDSMKKHLLATINADEKLDSLIVQLGQVAGLSSNYDQAMTIKCVIKYFEKYTKSKIR